MKPFKKLISAAIVAISATAALPVLAQAFPTKPIRIVVPYAPGAVTDTAARLVAAQMSTILGQVVMVENRGGAGTRIGVREVATSAPDGYTMLFVNSVTHGSMPGMSKSLQFDPVKDFAPVAPLFWYANVLVCNPKVKANTIAELIEYARANPGKLTSATAGPGTGHDLLGWLFKLITKTDIMHVHYRGGGPALQDVLAGNVDCIYGDGNAKQHVDAGRLKAFASAASVRDPVFPNVPTMIEAGVKGFDMPINQGLAVPAGTQPEIIAKLNAAANEALRSPQLMQRAADLGLVINGGEPEKLAKIIKDDLTKFGKVIDEAGIPKE